MSSRVGALENPPSRRDILRLLCAVAATGPAALAEPLLQAASFDHLNLRVSNPAHSAALYHALFGGELLRVASIPANPSSPPGEAYYVPTGESYLVISPAFAQSPPGLDHISVGLRDYDAEKVKATLEQRGIAAERNREDVWVRDPDGLPIQLRSPGGWGRLMATRGAAPAEISAGAGPPFTPAAILQIAVSVGDRNRSGDFYGRLFGAGTGARAAKRAMNVKFGGAVLALLPPTAAPKASTGLRLDHITIGVKDFKPDSVRRRLRELGIESYDPNHAGRVFFRDLDGIQLQLASAASPWG